MKLKLQHARLARTVLGAALLAASAAACVPVVVAGGAAAGGVSSATDRRPMRMQLLDQRIQADSTNAAWKLLGEGQRGHVNVNCYYRKVLITGEVPTEEDKQAVQAAVEQAGRGDIAGITNELAVEANSSLTQRAKDSAITTRVKTRLLNANGVPGNSISVVTEHGVTYLMGQLTEREKQLATEVTRTTKDVERVVLLIDTISAEAALHPDDPGVNPPAPAAAPASAPAPTPAPVENGVVTQPVTQPAIEQAPPPIQVQTLPAAK